MTIGDLTDLTVLRVAQRRRLVDGKLILDPVRGLGCGLDASGSFLLKALQRPMSVDAVEKATAEAFGVPAGAIRREVRPFLAGLVAVGLVEICGAGEAPDPSVH